MDTTPKYILMCEKAEEIQKQLDRAEEGELLAIDGNVYFQHHDVYWLNNYGNGKPCKQWVSGYWDSDNPTFFGPKAVWLPRQDQLQEMITVDCDCGMIWLHQSVKLDKFMNWLCNFEEDKSMEAYHQKKSYHTTLTWEQLWLAFVMKELYSKVWNSKDWVHEKN